jgi:amino acid transporter
MATTAKNPRSSTPRAVAKRVLVGRAKASHQLEHTLLPKFIALPVFSSDPLSSNAYATEEILVVLLAASVAATHLVMPIAAAIAVLMVIVITSYRQTVRAYPSGGGAYIVSKDNLGVLPGLVAAAALLTDYVLTVSVSISAGVLAITSAMPSWRARSVTLSLAFILLLTLANLRGVREAGSIFALPTYAFFVSIVATVGVGLVRCVGGCPTAEPLSPEHGLAAAAGSISLFVILHAFSSGSTALTGVEAISNGVPAFRRPQAHNAATTLGVMGAMAISMFLGLSWLATHIPGITVTHERSVVAQIAHTIFGGGIGFYVVQIFTAAILILAANTAYQDFPRLSSILARDGFMPSQFKNRGDRLVFSNGVIVLALLASALIVAFDADLNRLIQLYVVGVFTSFTLSQSGMVRHWLRERDRGPSAAKGWRRSIVINAVGAGTTGVVLLVIASTKFIHGAWIVIGAMPFIVLVLLAISRHYERVRRALTGPATSSVTVASNRFVFLVRDVGPATNEALVYLRGLRPIEVTPLYIGEQDGFDRAALWWAGHAARFGALQRLARTQHGVGHDLVAYLKAMPRETGGFVTVVIPEVVQGTSLWHLLVRQRRSLFLKARLLFTPEVVVTDVPLVPEEVSAAAARQDRAEEPTRSVVLLPISAVHEGSIRAADYARTLHASHLEALYFVFDLETQQEVVDAWWASKAPVPLSLVEAPFRDLGPPLLEEIRRHTARPGTVVTVVLPEFLVTRWWEQPLHGQTGLFIKRLLLTEPGVVVTSVPYRIRDHAGSNLRPSISHR